MTECNDFGPGVRWLAERAGVPPRELLANPGLLLRALGTAAKNTLDLAGDAISPTEEVRRTARERAEELSDRLASDTSPGERFISALHKLLHSEDENDPEHRA